MLDQFKNFHKAKFIKPLPYANVKNYIGDSIECLIGKSAGTKSKMFAKKGTSVLVTKDPTTNLRRQHYLVFFYDGCVLRMVEGSCQYYLKTERYRGNEGILTDNKYGAILAERFISSGSLLKEK